MNANAMQPMNRAMIPTRGRYVKRTSAYAANEPSVTAMSALESPTMTVLMYGRMVSLPSSTRM